jgi:hypothetical protein
LAVAHADHVGREVVVRRFEVDDEVLAVGVGHGAVLGSDDHDRRAHQGIAGVVGDPSGDLAGGTCAGN